MSSPRRIQALTMEEDIEGQGTTICQLLLPLRINDGMSSTFFNALSIKKKNDLTLISFAPLQSAVRKRLHSRQYYLTKAVVICGRAF